MITTARGPRRLDDGSPFADVACNSAVMVDHLPRLERARLTRVASHYAARRWTNQTAVPMRSRESANSQPPSIHWKGQNRLAGWYVTNWVKP